MWLWLREGKPLWVGILGGLILVLYGILPTLQPSVLDFGRVYAAYGGLFIVLSLLWGWIVDGKTPDSPSLVGAMIALVGAAVIVYWPRAA